MLFAAQEQALRTNSIKAKIGKQQVSSKCSLCWTKEETVMHLVNGWPSWHRNSTKEDVAGRVHWELCKKHGLEGSDRWYEHTPADAVENYEVNCTGILSSRQT